MPTRYLNEYSDGCLICGNTEQTTSHHIRNHGHELCVYICWHHHQILHACGLYKVDGEDYRFSTDDILLVLRVATRFKLFKVGEVKYVKRAIKEELNRRGVNQKGNKFKGRRSRKR